MLVPGFAEHVERYASFASHLAQSGVEVHLIDLPGHGQSQGTRALIDDAERIAVDLAALASELGSDERPVALFGHSFGGALVLRAAQHAPRGLRAVATTGPYLQSALPDPAWLLRLASGLSRIAPNLRTKPIDAGAVSNIEREVQAYAKDPLVDRGGVRLASIRELHAIGPAVLSNAGNLAVPTLILQGDRDALSDPAGAQALAAVSQRVTVRIVAGGAHDLLHDDQATTTQSAIHQSLVEAGVARPA